MLSTDDPSWIPVTNITTQSVLKLEQESRAIDLRYGTTTDINPYVKPRKGKPIFSCGFKFLYESTPPVVDGEEGSQHALPIRWREVQSVCQVLCQRRNDNVNSEDNCYRYFYLLSQKSCRRTRLLLSEESIVRSIQTKTRTVVKIPPKDISRLSRDADVYCLPQGNPDDEHTWIKYAPSIIRYPSSSTLVNNNGWFTNDNVFSCRYKDENWKSNLAHYMKALHHIIKDHLNKLTAMKAEEACPRMYWKQWLSKVVVNIPAHSRSFYYFAIVQFSISQGDSQLQGPINELFGSGINHPGIVAASPLKVYAFFMATAPKQTLEELFDIQDDDEDDDIEAPEATKGVVYWIQKSEYFIYNSKLMCLRYVATFKSIESKCDAFGNINDRIEFLLRRCQLRGLEEMKQQWRKALPSFILDLVPTNVCIMPATFDENYYLEMMGYHYKCTALAAEAIYSIAYCIAVDRHVQRWTIIHAIVTAMMSNRAEVHMNTLKLVFEPELYSIVNEVPCAISQIIRNKADANALIARCLEVGHRYGYGEFMQKYIDMCK